jgi:hypothetical protein
MPFGVEESISFHEALVFEINENAGSSSLGGLEDRAEQTLETELRESSFFRIEDGFAFQCSNRHNKMDLRFSKMGKGSIQRILPETNS